MDVLKNVPKSGRYRAIVRKGSRVRLIAKSDAHWNLFEDDRKYLDDMTAKNRLSYTDWLDGFEKILVATVVFPNAILTHNSIDESALPEATENFAYGFSVGSVWGDKWETMFVHWGDVEFEVVPPTVKPKKKPRKKKQPKPTWKRTKTVKLPPPMPDRI